MDSSFLKKQHQLMALFAHQSPEAQYEELIRLGRAQPRLDAKFKHPANLVKGCQSLMYLHCHFEQGRLYFVGESDALISAGLAALLTKVYSGETAETVLKQQPDYLDSLSIKANLTPSRANGLYSIHLRMKQDALKFLVEMRDVT